MPLFIVESELAIGALFTIVEQHHLSDHGIYAVYPQLAFIPAKLRVFLDFLEQKLSQILTRVKLIPCLIFLLAE